MNKAARNRLEHLLGIASPSGEESALQNACRRELEDYTGPITRDVHGNQYYPLTDGRARRVMLCAHADEIGLMVQGIDEKGFLRVVPIGGVDANTIGGQRVRIGAVPGVIGQQPIHLQEKQEQPKTTPLHERWVDIGARSRKEAKRLVSIGDTAILDTPATWLRNDRVAARGLDNRISVFVLLEVLRRLARRKLAVDVIGVTSVQEEIGLRGAITSGYTVAPDIAINVDVSFATDHPRGDAERWGDTRLSRGPILACGAGVNSRLLAEFERTAVRYDIPCQRRAEPDAAGSDASALQTTRGGVAVMDIGIPNRYMHTAVEMVCLHDVAHAIELITRWIAACPADADYVAP